MALQCKHRDSILPFNISIAGNRFCHFCFDNFDLLEETKSGAETTHTTHGIVIQEIMPLVADPPAGTSSLLETVVVDSDASTSQAERETTQFFPDSLEPYFKHPHIEPVLAQSALEQPPSITVPNIKVQELAWTLCRAKHNNEYRYQNGVAGFQLQQLDLHLCSSPLWATWHPFYTLSLIMPL